jgi:metal-responsive CopG/Arc/MetJ family transcriptional regulator
MTPSKSLRIITPMAQLMVDRIDAYRCKNGIRSRSEAVRLLVAHGLEGTSASQERHDRMDAWDADVARMHEAKEDRPTAAMRHR